MDTESACCAVSAGSIAVRSVNNGSGNPLPDIGFPPHPG